MPPVEIRRADAADLPAIAEVRALAWQAAYAGLVPDSLLAPLTDAAALDAWVQRVAAHDSTTWLVATGSGRAIGFCAYGAERDTEDPSRGEVYAIYVHPRHWRRGVGADLLRTALDDLVGRGVRTVSLWVLEGNDAASAFYERHGFETTGERLTDERGLVELRMARDLTT